MSETSVNVDDAAPDVTLRDHDGTPVALASFWKDGPVALVFLRHFG